MIFPKPMLPIGGMPIIAIIVQQLAYSGFKDIIISLGYLGDYIKRYFDDKNHVPAGTTIRYVEETEPLGTAGPISLLENYTDDFLVLNGDLLTSIDFMEFLNFHRNQDALLSIAVGIKNVKMNLGIIELEGNRVTNFKEKPVFTYHDNMGIYIYNRKVLNYIEKNKRLDFNELVRLLLDKKEKVLGYLSEKPYYWIDIGQHADYERANKEFKKFRGEFLKA